MALIRITQKESGAAAVESLTPQVKPLTDEERAHAAMVRKDRERRGQYEALSRRQFPDHPTPPKEKVQDMKEEPAPPKEEEEVVVTENPEGGNVQRAGKKARGKDAGVDIPAEEGDSDNEDSQDKEEDDAERQEDPDSSGG